LRSSISVPFWYRLISRRATVPGRKRNGFFTPLLLLLAPAAAFLELFFPLLFLPFVPKPFRPGFPEIGVSFVRAMCDFGWSVVLEEKEKISQC
jgi:hypothetical protein